MEVKEILQSAKEGNIDSKKVLYDRYTYIADKFYDKYKDYVTKEQVYDIYNKLFNQYFLINYSFGISFYLHKQYYYAIREYIPERVLLSEHIKNAMNGDKRAREELINHYSSIVINKAKDCDYLKYEELVQYGMIKLIEMIDSNLEHGVTECWAGNLCRSIDIYFENTLKEQVLSYNLRRKNCDYRSSVEMNELLMDKEYVHSFSKMEIDDLINSSNLTKKQKLYALKYFVDGTSVCEISDEYGCSTQAVHEQVGKVSNRLAHNFKK